MATVSSRTRSVLDRLEIGPDEVRYARVAAPDEIGPRYPLVTISRSIYAELGEPFELTVTIEPGNKIVDDDQYSEHVHPFDRDTT